MEFWNDLAVKHRINDIASVQFNIFNHYFPVLKNVIAVNFIAAWLMNF